MPLVHIRGMMIKLNVNTFTECTYKTHTHKHIKSTYTAWHTLMLYTGVQVKEDKERRSYGSIRRLRRAIGIRFKCT